jgi:hypothetical protein
MKKQTLKKTVSVLTEADRDRIEAAIGLVRQIFRDILSMRRVRVNTEVQTPAALYELEQEARYIQGVVDGLSPDYREEQLNFEGL